MSVDSINETNFITNSLKCECSEIEYPHLSRLKQVFRQSREWILRKDLKWPNIIMIFTFYALGIYALIYFPYIERYKTVFWAYFLAVFSGFGVTGGAHRFWSHRSYSAKLQLRTFLAVCYVIAVQNKLFDWVRDHRLHHKFSETNSDPHNSHRGFFFSHVGWLMMKKHPDVIAKGKQLDMSDIKEDSVAEFIDRYFGSVRIAATFITIAIPVYFWNEDWYYSSMAQYLRIVYTMNATWSLNSFAHIWGSKPYRKNIAPVQNYIVNLVTWGEGSHNYHHAFPYDYRVTEFGVELFDATAAMINFFIKIGWAYDPKTSSKSLVKMSINNHGDGTISKAVIS